MSYMTWSDQFVTGNAEIDAQHQKLVEIINRLHDAMRIGKAASILSGIFDELLDYTGYHFQTEERLYGPVNYPQKEEHIAEHKALVEQALGLQAKFRANTAFVTIEVMEFLKNWIHDHILKMDMTYKGLI